MDFFDDEKIMNVIKIAEIVLLLSIIGLLVFIGFFKKEEEKVHEVTEEIAVKDTKEEVPIIKELKDYRVDIKGSVKNPGVYTMKEGSIINELIELAGGIKSGATLKNINLSKKIEDEMVVYVYTTNELNKLKVDPNESKECQTNTYNISSCEGASVIKSSNTPTTNSTSNSESNDNKPTVVNINTAGIDELVTLTGIGEAKAKAIIEYRESNGGFKTIEEIKNISGIGDASFEKIKDYITI